LTKSNLNSKKMKAIENKRRSLSLSGSYGIMTRSAAERFGVSAPADVAYYRLRTGGGREAVTWKDIHAARARSQQGNLARKRYPERRRMAAMLKVCSTDWTCGYAFCKTRQRGCIYWVDFGNPNAPKLREWLQASIAFQEPVCRFKEWKNLFEQKIGSLPVLIDIDRRGDIIAIEIYQKR
jgi:hypothetical protein